MTGRDYLGYVKRLPCAACVILGYVSPESHSTAVSDAHHPRTGVGAARKAPDADAIPLCPAHHRSSNDALHVMGRKAWERWLGTTELELSRQTKLRVQQMIAMEV